MSEKPPDRPSDIDSLPTSDGSESPGSLQFDAPESVFVNLPKAGEGPAGVELRDLEGETLSHRCARGTRSTPSWRCLAKAAWVGVYLAYDRDLRRRIALKVMRKMSPPGWPRDSWKRLRSWRSFNTPASSRSLRSGSARAASPTTRCPSFGGRACDRSSSVCVGMTHRRHARTRWRGGCRCSGQIGTGPVATPTRKRGDPPGPQAGQRDARRSRRGAGDGLGSVEGGRVPRDSATLPLDASGLDARSGRSSARPHYMAPEQARGEEVDERRRTSTSLGVMLYELLCPGAAVPGQSDRGDGLAAILNQRASATAEPGTEPVSDTPRALEAVCLQALQEGAGRAVWIGTRTMLADAVQDLGLRRKRTRRSAVTSWPRRSAAEAGKSEALAEYRRAGRGPDPCAWSVGVAKEARRGRPRELAIGGGEGRSSSLPRTESADGSSEHLVEADARLW